MVDEANIVFNDYTNTALVEMFSHVKKINPSHFIRIYYCDTYYDIDLNNPYSKIEVYMDYVKFFTMENINNHERMFVNPFCGDSCRLIMVKDIKSIEF